MKNKKSKKKEAKAIIPIPVFATNYLLGGNAEYIIYTDDKGKPYWFELNRGEATPVKFT